MLKRIVNKYFEVVPLFRFKEIELKERLTLIFYVTGFILSIIAFTTTLLIGMPFWLNIPNLTIMILCLFLPFLFPNNISEIGLKFLYFVAFIYLPITYFTNGGHNGVGILYFLMIIVYISFFLEGKKLLYMLILSLTYYTVLIVLGYYVPALIIPYADDTSRFIDIVVSLVGISIILSVISNAVFRNYNLEKNQVYSLMKELEDRNERLETLSNTDQLTEVYNRRYFMDALQIEFDVYNETKKHFYVMMIDLDNFKNVNDTYGHLYGDEILKSVSIGIKSCLRNHDVVARYGGEEFSVIISHSNKENGFVIAERIRNSIEKINYRNENIVTISVGVVKNNDKDTILGILKRADRFLYIAKENGKNRVEGEQ